MLLSSTRLFGMLISAIFKEPEYSAPGYTKCPIFGRQKVTVKSARTAQPLIWPLSESMPEGISTAITGFLDLLIKSIAFAYMPDISFFSPVPKIASIIMSAFLRPD